jgi:hypothetical protein
MWACMHVCIYIYIYIYIYILYVYVYVYMPWSSYHDWLQTRGRPVPEYWRNKYENEARRMWDVFYKWVNIRANMCVGWHIRMCTDTYLKHKCAFEERTWKFWQKLCVLFWHASTRIVDKRACKEYCTCTYCGLEQGSHSWMACLLGDHTHAHTHTHTHTLSLSLTHSLSYGYVIHGHIRSLLTWPMQVESNKFLQRPSLSGQGVGRP